MNFICETLATKYPSELSKKLPDLLSGSPVPSNSDSNQTSRNLQFQFFMAAILAHSGYSVNLEEPDAIFVHSNAKIGIAAKRPSSRNADKVANRVLEGAKQLKKAGLPGFVALSLDQLTNPPNPIISSANGTNEGLDEAIQNLVGETFRPYAKKIHSEILGTDISGIVISLTTVGFIRVPWHPVHATGTLWLPRTDGLIHEKSLVIDIVNALKGPGEI